MHACQGTVAVGALAGARAPEVLRGGGQDLVAAQLALGVADAQHVAQQRGVALGVRQLVRVHVADGADDGLGQRIVVQLQAAQEGGRAIVYLHLCDHRVYVYGVG